MTDFMLVVLGAILISGLLGFGGSATATQVSSRLRSSIILFVLAALNRLIRGGYTSPPTGDRLIRIIRQRAVCEFDRVVTYIWTMLALRNRSPR